jgi:tetratricopeptide (TPR) repeat protein
MKRTIVILFLLSFYAAAQDSSALEQQFEFANSLYNQGRLYDAVTEYERLLYFDTLHTFSFEANKNIAACYRRSAQYKQAITYTGRAMTFMRDPQLLFDKKIELVKLHILNKTFSSASNVLIQMEQDTTCHNRIQEVYYWRGWLFMFQDNWRAAEKEFAKVDSAKALERFCGHIEDKRYSFEIMEILSVVVPGSGQMLTGHVWNGLLSLGWNVLWGYLTIDAAVANRVGDALLIGDLLWLRFYVGNIENAGTFAKEKNAQLFQDALRYLQDEFIGAKP